MSAKNEQLHNIVKTIQDLDDNLRYQRQLFVEIWKTFEREVCHSVHVGSIAKRFPLNVFDNIRMQHMQLFTHFLKSWITANKYSYPLKFGHQKYSEQLCMSLAIAVALVKAKLAARVVSTQFKRKILSCLVNLRELQEETFLLLRGRFQLEYRHEAIFVAEYDTGVNINDTLDSFVEYMRSVNPKLVESLLEKDIDSQDREEFMSIRRHREHNLLIWCLFKVGGQAFQQTMSLNSILGPGQKRTNNKCLCKD